MLRDSYQVVTQVVTSLYLTVNCFCINQKVSGTEHSIFFDNLIEWSAPYISEGALILNQEQSV